MTIVIGILQLLVLVLGAPLVRGIIARLKARLQRRRGASIWRPYSELFKLLRKEELVPPTSSVVFRLAPIVLLSATICVAAFVPVVHSSALIASQGDFFLLVYLLALGRFFLSLGALDGGSAFGGMGASREALVSSLAEAPFLLGLVAVAILASHADIAVGLLIVLLSVIESAVAKLRMYLVPDFLGVASAVSALAVIFTVLVRR